MVVLPNAVAFDSHHGNSISTEAIYPVISFAVSVAIRFSIGVIAGLPVGCSFYYLFLFTMDKSCFHLEENLKFKKIVYHTEEIYC